MEPDAPTATPPAPVLRRGDAVLIALASGASAASSLVVFAITARTLSVSDNTSFQTFWSFLFACFGVLSGMSIETTRAVAAAATAPGGAQQHTPRRARPLLVGAVIGLGLGAVMAVGAPLWSRHVFTQEPLLTGLLAASAVAAYAAHNALVGALAGRRRWTTYATLIGADSVARVALVALAAATSGHLLVLVGMTAASALTWAVVLATVKDARSAAVAPLDSDVLPFLRRTAAAAAAVGTSALLVVGFPVLLTLTSAPEEIELAAPLLGAIVFTRAPLMVPLTAFQGVAVTHFVARRAEGLRALWPLLRAVCAVAALAALAAWAVGSPILEAVQGPGYGVDGRLLAALTLAAACVAVLTLTGSLCQALTRHAAFLAGWVVALVVAVAVLLLPADLEVRAAVALAVGPLVGIGVHVRALRRASASGRVAAPEGAAGPIAATQAPPDDVRASVCMATYNGARHVTEQVSSILEQLGDRDELVVVDDGSRDATVALVSELADPRVRVVPLDRNHGYVAAFQEALREARGRYLVLADQDDVWLPGRLEALVDALGASDVVATNLSTLGGPPRIRGPYGQQDWHLRAADGRHPRRNVLGVLAGNRPYYGCAMALRRDALRTLLPFPAFLTESHDLWIALYGNLARSMTHLELRSVERRFHDDNASPARPRGPVVVVRSRLMLLRAVVELTRRLRLARTP